MPKKWGDKEERDLLLAMRIAESSYNPVSQKTWEKAARLMTLMGYEGSSALAISEGTGDASVAVPSAAAAPAPPAPGRRGKQTKREKEEDDDEDDKGEVAKEKKAPAAKKQKQKKN
ncbi:hypothetical protein F4802DRAFT_600279 [Xylaria palmicola]|nr:hypothetical protein F4802DRAFT_600279 [Xylaria palmicola]